LFCSVVNANIYDLSLIPQINISRLVSMSHIHRIALRSLTLRAGLLLFAMLFTAGAQQMRDFQVPQPVPDDSCLVIGFLGGFEPWNDPHRGIRKVALDLRSLAIPGLYVETIENHRRKLALKLIERSMNADANHRIRVILYGQSWGGAAVVQTARDLQKLGIGVDLTIQVDSVGRHDAIVPANVANAANIYQHDVLSIGGRQKIQAEDPSSTHILENVQLSYLLRPYSTLGRADTSWVRRTLGGSHAKMEADGMVWEHVEQLILSSIQK
jgi:hypothetical protein